MELLARVTPRIFAAIDCLAAKNDVRYYLNGICIQRNPAGGIVVVATDGQKGPSRSRSGREKEADAAWPTTVQGGAKAAF